MGNTTIRFPYLGLELHPGRYIEIFGIKIAYYGIIIGLAMVIGALAAYFVAYKTHQNIEAYLDYTIIAILVSIAGARIYYCIFNWGYYSSQPLKIITGIGEGGLAIYGGIIAAVAALYIFARRRKMSFLLMADTACVGLAIGQSIGRWGNFFNREAFGGYTDSIFAMQIPVKEAHGLTRDLLLNTYIYNGESYVQVHPTFFYESVWTLVLFIILCIVIKHKKYNGQVFAVYLFGYGLGRMWIEALRTDKLMLFGTSVPVSLMLSVILMAASSVFMTWNMLRLYGRNAIKLQAEQSDRNRNKNDTTSGQEVNIIEEIVKEDEK